MTLPRPAITPPAPWSFPSGEEFTLDNGLRVVLQHLPGQYVVSAGLLVDAPLTGEPAACEGVAAVTASALLEGTRAHPGTAFAERVEACGAAMDAEATHSHTHVVVDVPGARLRPALSLLAEAVIEPCLDDDDVDRLRQQHAAAQAQQLATGSGRANHALRRALVAPQFRASRGRYGAPGSLDRITAEDVRTHHAHAYGPRGAVLVISGDAVGDARELVADCFGGWANPDQQAAVHESPAAREPHAWLIDRPGAVQADVRLGWFTLDRTDARWADLQIGANALGGAYLSRLNRVLREERGLSYGVSLTNTPMRRGGLSHVQGSFRTEAMAEVLALMPGLLDVASAPLGRDEVDRARDYLIGTAPLRYATASQVTSGLLTLTAAGLTADAVHTQLEGYRESTPAAATEVSAELLDPERACLLVVGDAAALAGPLADAGWDATLVPEGAWL